MQTELQFLRCDALNDSSVSAIDWLQRTYDIFVQWKSKARKEFVSLNGDSNAARNRIAGIVRSYFIDSQLTPEDVGRWKGNEIVTIKMSPPIITDSNATYVDWIYIADFLLLHCAAEQEDVVEENQRREAEFLKVFNSYKLRLAVAGAQKLIRQEVHMSDKELFEALIEHHPTASLATIKEARKREKLKIAIPEIKEPRRSLPIPLFIPLHFQP